MLRSVFSATTVARSLVSMLVQIEHTITFAYPNGSANLTMGEMANLVETLDANPGDMQLSLHYANGQAVEIRMSLAGGNVQYVRVYDLPSEKPINTLC